MQRKYGLKLWIVCILAVLSIVGIRLVYSAQVGIPPIRHVLLISVDGLHALDLANFVHAYPKSALAQLSGTGVTYTQAATAKPSNSFPGLMTMLTGGSPIST